MKNGIIAICIVAIIGTISALSNVFDNNLDGKTIAFIGDSLMAGYGNEDKGLDYYFSSYFPNSKLINKSKGGSTVTSNTGDDDIVIINQIENLTGEPDAILFDGGANDIIGYGIGYLDNNLKKDIGTIDKDLKKIADENTVMGDMERIILKLKEKYPKAKLYYIKLFAIDDDTIENVTVDGSKKAEMQARNDNFIAQLKILCEKRNVEYIDITDKLDGSRLQYRQDDWIHISETGYKKLTPFILERMGQL